MTANPQPIGVFDSGVGGLSVLRHLHAQLPHESFLYLADQAHVPYGGRSAAEVQHFSEGALRFLLARGCKLIVVACNTASAAALTYLRETFPNVPIVGMEPAVKPAAQQTRSGKVGVLATASTFGSPRYAWLMARFAQHVAVCEDPCHGLVPLIEAGATDTPETAALLRAVLRPMLAGGVDTLVLGCTHYPFVRPLIERIVAEESAATGVAIIDPAPAVARQAQRVLRAHGLRAAESTARSVRLVTTGDGARLAQLTQQLLDVRFSVETAVWRDGRVVVAD